MNMADEIPLTAGVDYKILLTDSDLNYVGDPITDWISLDITLKHNEPSAGLFTAPAYPWIKNEILPGRRVVVIRTLGPEYDSPPSVLISGPFEDDLHERADDGENAGDGMLTVHFADDFAKIAARQAYPNVTQTAAGQTVDRWQFSGNAEAALRELVNGNAGPGALPARQVSQLVLGAAAGVGTNVVVNAQRMEPLGDLMRQIAELGGNLGFRTRQVGRQILFEVYQPPDKTNEVKFGFGLGNLKYLAVQRKAPTATTAIVGGQGEGADRALTEWINNADEATWGRFEKLISRPGNNAMQELQDDGYRALADGASTVRLTSNVSDTPEQRFGHSYNVGDRVAVETGPGQYLTELISTVHLQVWNGAGEYVSPTVGSQADQSDPIWTQRLREIEDRLGRIERSVKPAVLPA